MLTRGSTLIALLFVGACTTTPRIPLTLGDPQNAPTYGYTPLDPIPVQFDESASRSEILNALPDETIRLAIGRVSGRGGVIFGPAQIGAEGNSYVIVLDYVKFTTSSFPVQIETDTSGARVAVLTANATAEALVPVYVGVGLRLTANVTVQEGSVDLGNLFALGAAAEANRLTGTLVVQTLGISGQNITALVPMPGKIDDTTIQNALVALGAIKAKLYDEGTQIVPRALGVYNTLGGGEDAINGFISTLFLRGVTLDLRTRQVR